MKSKNPRYLVESILEGVDYVDERLDQALDERIEQYHSNEARDPWQRVLARWLIVRESFHGQIRELKELIDTANRQDLHTLTLDLHELATTLQTK
jgi:hypothetical protein